MIQRYVQTGDIALRKASVGMRIHQVILMSGVVYINGSRTDLASVIGDFKKARREGCPFLTGSGAAYRTRTCDPRITNAAENFQNGGKPRFKPSCTGMFRGVSPMLRYQRDTNGCAAVSPLCAQKL